MKSILWLIFIAAGIGCFIGGLLTNVALAAGCGVAFTMAVAALGIIGAVERIGDPKPVGGIPEEI